MSRFRSRVSEPSRRSWLPVVHGVIVAVTVVGMAALAAQPELHAIPLASGSQKGPYLTVRVRDASFDLFAGTARLTIPPAADGAPDYARLTASLAKVKERMPGEIDLVVIGDADLEYGALVAAIDAIREDAHGNELFPEPRLGFSL